MMNRGTITNEGLQAKIICEKNNYLEICLKIPFKKNQSKKNYAVELH